MLNGIRGIPVALTVKTQTGVDAFKAPVYSETEVTVNNVLVSPASETEILESINLYGKKAIYTLCIPKGDNHNWENTTVKFFNKKWRTIGAAQEYIEELLPLDWNKKVRVESIVSNS